MLTPEKVTLPTLPLATCGDAPAVTTVGVKTNPDPTDGTVIFPAVAVTLPVVAMTPVPPVTVVAADKDVPALIVVVDAIEPGAINMAGIDKVATPEIVLTLISLAVGNTDIMLPEEINIQFDCVSPVMDV